MTVLLAAAAPQRPARLVGDDALGDDRGISGDGVQAHVGEILGHRLEGIGQPRVGGNPPDSISVSRATAATHDAEQRPSPPVSHQAAG